MPVSFQNDPFYGFVVWWGCLLIFDFPSLFAAEQLSKPEELQGAKEDHRREVHGLPCRGYGADMRVSQQGPPEFREEKEAALSKSNEKKTPHKQRMHDQARGAPASPCLKDEVPCSKEGSAGLK